MLLVTGSTADVRELLSGDLRGSLGFMPGLDVPVYEWFQLVLAAVAGDADEADNYAADLLARVSPDRRKRAACRF